MSGKGFVSGYKDGLRSLLHMIPRVKLLSPSTVNGHVFINLCTLPAYHRSYRLGRRMYQTTYSCGVARSRSASTSFTSSSFSSRRHVACIECFTYFL